MHILGYYLSAVGILTDLVREFGVGLQEAPDRDRLLRQGHAHVLYLYLERVGGLDGFDACDCSYSQTIVLAGGRLVLRLQLRHALLQVFDDLEVLLRVAQHLVLRRDVGVSHELAPSCLLGVGVAILAPSEGESLCAHNFLDQESPLVPQVIYLFLFCFHVLCLVLHPSSIIVVIRPQPFVLPAFQLALMALDRNRPFFEGHSLVVPLGVEARLQHTEPVPVRLSLFHVRAPFVDAPRQEVELAVALLPFAIGKESAECSFNYFFVLLVVVL